MVNCGSVAVNKLGLILLLPNCNIAIARVTSIGPTALRFVTKRKHLFETVLDLRRGKNREIAILYSLLMYLFCAAGFGTTIAFEKLIFKKKSLKT